MIFCKSGTAIFCCVQQLYILPRLIHLLWNWKTFLSEQQLVSRERRREGKNFNFHVERREILCVCLQNAIIFLNHHLEMCFYILKDFLFIQNSLSMLKRKTSLPHTRGFSLLRLIASVERKIFAGFNTF